MTYLYINGYIHMERSSDMRTPEVLRSPWWGPDSLQDAPILFSQVK